MKLFGIKIGSAKPAKLRVTPEDRNWVDRNFEWLLSAFAHRGIEQITISEKYFPHTFESKDIKIENLIADCCNHLSLNPKLFSYEIIEDIRDSEDMPYAFVENPLDCFLNIDKQTGKYSIDFAKTIFNHPHWLITLTCIQFGKARLHQSKLNYGEGAETNLFLYLVAVHFGYGVILADNLANTGTVRNATWETKWTYIAELPYPVLAYALAVSASLTGNREPAWKELLSKEIRKEFDLSMTYINQSEKKLFNAESINRTIQIDKLLKHAATHYKSGRYKEAISLLQETISLADDDAVKANVYNNIGYYQLRSKQYHNSISAFENALMLSPDYGYATDNLGFALIMLGELDKGKEYLEKALKTKNNDNAYSYRNMALYYQKKGDIVSAEANFKKAFAMQTKVDLLDFFYGLFLLENGDKQKAAIHIQKSADIGEYEGIEKMKAMF
jgi:tetratricopeptide (TPR) repeat protein